MIVGPAAPFDYPTPLFKDNMGEVRLDKEEVGGVGKAGGGGELTRDRCQSLPA